MSLKVSKLSKRYHNNWVLRDVSFEAKSGEITGVFGVKGSGKSTLIEILSGNEKSNGGKIFKNQDDVSNFSFKERGFLLPKIERDSFWKKLFKFEKRPKLSDGETQLHVLKNALERARDVLLLDEPLCCLDKITRNFYFEELRKATLEKNLTVVFATADFEQIFALCDKTAVLANGEIQQFDSPQKIYEKPANSFIAAVSGRNNLIKARRLSSSKSEIHEFQTLEGGHRLFTDKVEKHLLGAINQDIFLAIRPEHISISFGASFPEDNLIKALITDIVFQGSTTLVKLDANGLPIEAIVLRLVGLNIGDECMVGLPPDRISILKT